MDWTGAEVSFNLLYLEREENSSVPNAGILASRMTWEQMGFWVSYFMDYILILLSNSHLILCKSSGLSDVKID